MDAIKTTSAYQDIDRLVFARLDENTVRILHRGTPVADVPAVALADHIARRGLWKWARRRRSWNNLVVDVSPEQKVTLAVRHRARTTTLSAEELAGLGQLLAPPPRRAHP